MPKFSVGVAHAFVLVSHAISWMNVIGLQVAKDSCDQELSLAVLQSTMCLTKNRLTV